LQASGGSERRRSLTFAMEWSIIAGRIIPSNQRNVRSSYDKLRSSSLSVFYQGGL
jgi:hypothetical protein